MAYMNQEKKAKIAAKLKEMMPKDWKYTLAVLNNSTIVCTISKAPVDLISELNEQSARNHFNHRNAVGYFSVNTYYLDRQFDKSLPIIQSIVDALNLGNYDDSDIMSDYHRVGHYVNLNIGRYNYGFIYSGESA